MDFGTKDPALLPIVDRRFVLADEILGAGRSLYRQSGERQVKDPVKVVSLENYKESKDFFDGVLQKIYPGRYTLGEVVEDFSQPIEPSESQTQASHRQEQN